LPAGLLAASGPLLAPLALGYKASSNTPCNLMQAILMVIGEPCQRAKALNCMHNPPCDGGLSGRVGDCRYPRSSLQGEEGMPRRDVAIFSSWILLGQITVFFIVPFSLSHRSKHRPYQQAVENR